MDHFDDRGKHQMLVDKRTGRLAGEEQKGGPQAFSAVKAPVLQQFIHVLRVATQFFSQQMLDLDKFVFDGCQ
jgi:hypothetical protein